METTKDLSNEEDQNLQKTLDNKKRLVTSALPYVNNIPHLGNLIQVISADVYARFCRSRQYKTLYICGTDEYGTATETRATAEKTSAKELCDRYFVQHRDIYKWFNISFDKFGRTSAPIHSKIVQDVFFQIYEAGYITNHKDKQLFSQSSNMFLADRYVRGTCPKCAYKDARGDQCENCSTLLDPKDLIDPVSIVDGTRPVVKETSHLYINLPKALPLLQKWMHGIKQSWSHNAVKMTEAWIRDGLRERAITRDLKWGISVPLEEFKHKVFYVWFDAPIGYVSITASHTKDWKSWWKNPKEVKLVQFAGKDNIPFHTVLFPATQLISENFSKELWTKLSSISSTEYFNYEGGMFSKSRGVGIFGNDVIESGISVDMWRFYMMYNRPETSDYTFTWNDFKESVNGQLINNLSNLCNRTFAFIDKHVSKNIIKPNLNDEQTQKLWHKIINKEKSITVLMEEIQIRKAYKEIFALCDYGNKLFQDYAPWKLKENDLEKTTWFLHNLVYLIRDIAILIAPFTPDTAAYIFDILNLEKHATWQDLCVYDKNFERAVLGTIKQPKLFFTRLENKRIAELKEKFSGDQNVRKAQNKKEEAPKNIKLSEFTAKTFAQNVCLKTAKIIKVEKHPNANTLYILELDDASEQGRTIVSGLRTHYKEQDLMGKTIIVVANLKPAKLRGVMSNGMLLAASKTEAENEIVDVLFLDDVALGAQMLPQDIKSADTYNTIKADIFFSFKLYTKNGFVGVDGIPFVVEGKNVTTKKVLNGSVG